MKILSLNVNGFRGMVQMGNYVSDDKLTKNLNNLKSFINGVLLDDCSVAILQEIPYQTVDCTTNPWTWEEDKFYCLFRQLFENEYKVFFPKHMINSKQCTVAIGRKNTKWNYAKKEIIKYDKKYSYGNKIVEIELENISLLGVHVKPCDEMWEILLNSLRLCEVTYVVGDFNAYEKRGEMKGKPNQLRNLGYSSVIPSNVITNFIRESSIDNLYINLNCKLTEGIHVDVQRTDDFLTDHAACVFEF